MKRGQATLPDLLGLFGGSFTGIIFHIVAFLQRREVSFFEVEISTRNHFLPTISPRPVDNLRCVSSEEGAVSRLERLTVFSRKDIDVRVATVADELQIFFKLGLR